MGLRVIYQGWEEVGLSLARFFHCHCKNRTRRIRLDVIGGQPVDAAAWKQPPKIIDIREKTGDPIDDIFRNCMRILQKISVPKFHFSKNF